MHSTCAVPHVPLSPAKRYTWLASAFRLLGHLHSSLVSWGSGTIRNSGCLSLYRSRRIIPSHGCGSASGFVVGWKQRVAYHVILAMRWRARATETCVGKRSLDINVVDPRGFGTVNYFECTTFGALPYNILSIWRLFQPRHPSQNGRTTLSIPMEETS